MGSIPFMLKDKHIEEFIVSEYYDLDNLVGEHMVTSDVQLTRVKLDDAILRNGHTFHVLSPDKSRGANENSLLLQTMFGGEHWLFTGDIYQNNEPIIINSYDTLQADELKLAH